MVDQNSKFLINCDLGEGLKNDILLMPYIDACSVACGGHAGNENTIKTALNQAKALGVAVGAHPSIPDKENFGRKETNISAEALAKSLHQQVSLFRDMCMDVNMKMHHIKLHGALYNLAARDRSTSQLVMDTLSDFRSTPFFAPWESVFYRVAIAKDIKVIPEAFADRRYNPDLSLQSRDQPGSLITNAEESLHQVLQIVHKSHVETTSGETARIKATTFCVHGDNPSALSILKKLKTVQK